MLKKIGSFSAYAVFLLALCEGFLWLVASFSDSVQLLLSNQYGAPRYIDDPLLGLSPNPDFAEHDEWGYRNALIGRLGMRSRQVPSQVDIVALGDSQTYAIMAPAEDSWPAQLNKITCRSVYNMAVGATGPPRYLHNLDQALVLNPKLVIVGLYFGNDFWDSAEFVYHRARVPEDLEAWRQVFRESNPAFAAFMEKLYPATMQRSLDAATILEPGFSKASPSVREQRASEQNESGIRNFFRDNSKLYGFLRLAKSMATNSVVREGRHEARSRADPEFWKELCDYAAKTLGVVCYETANVQTVLDTRLRIRDERVLQAGFETALNALSKIRDRLQERSIDYLVILIPSKEYIYTQALPGRFDDVDPTFAALGEQEGRIRDRVRQELKALDISYHDLLPDLILEVQRDRPIYPASSQSHPNSLGYGVIAKSIAQYLRKVGWRSNQC